jgi:hypothetical protein
MKTRTVEFLAAWDSKRWDTVLEEVPVNIPDDKLNDWAQDNLSGQCQYRDVVLFAVYCTDPLGREEQEPEQEEPKAPRYLVSRRDVHIDIVAVEAANEAHAIKLVKNGEGEELSTEYSHPLDTDTWTVEKEVPT